MAKKIKDPVAKFVTGNKQTNAPKPKSETPKVKASGDKQRACKFGKTVKY